MWGDERDALGVYLDPGVEDGLAVVTIAQEWVVWRAAKQIGAKGDTADNGGGRNQKTATGDAFGLAHLAPPASVAAAA